LDSELGVAKQRKAKDALAQARPNKGTPGADDMSVDDLAPHRKELA
jgi:hypothetical protein